MGFTELCIRRPVFATVLSLVLVLAGLMSFNRLTIREYPNIDEPQVTVVTSYTGASAEIVESQVTQVLEGSLAGIEGIDTIESTSRAESSRITIRFRNTVDINAATSDVRDRVSRVRNLLPDEISEPNISKVEADAQPIIFLVMQSTSMNALELTDYVDRFVVNRFKNLDGVADVTINGERRYAMRIWIDPSRLAGYGLTVQDVENAIRNQNADIPAGRIESTEREFTVLSRTALATPAEFERIVLKPAGGLQVRLGDVARVELVQRRCAARRPLQRQDRDLHRHREAGGGQSAGCVARGEGHPAASQCRPSGRRVGLDRLRFDSLHRPVHRECLHHHSRGRRHWCSSSSSSSCIPSARPSFRSSPFRSR